MKLTRAIVLAASFAIPTGATVLALAEDKPAAEAPAADAKAKKSKKAKKEGEAAPAEGEKKAEQK